MDILPTREEKLSSVKEAIDDCVRFLGHYIPLANTHAADFIVRSLWEKLIPPHIQVELLKMSEQQLISLPQKVLESAEESVLIISEENTNLAKTHSPKGSLSETDLTKLSDTDSAGSVDTKFEKCDQLNFACVGEIDNKNVIPINSHKNSKDIKTAEDIQAGANSLLAVGEPVTWPHESVAKFVQAAARHSLDGDIGTRILTPLLDVRGAGSQSLAKGELMSEKKAHEVDILADMCSTLAERYKCQLVIDVGSGKGYLGTHLASKYSVRTLSIDSAVGNTKSAVSRAEALDQKRTKTSKKYKTSDTLKHSTSKHLGPDKTKHLVCDTAEQSFTDTLKHPVPDTFQDPSHDLLQDPFPDKKKCSGYCLETLQDPFHDIPQDPSSDILQDPSHYILQDPSLDSFQDSYPDQQKLLCPDTIKHSASNIKTVTDDSIKITDKREERSTPISEEHSKLSTGTFESEKTSNQSGKFTESPDGNLLSNTSKDHAMMDLFVPVTHFIQPDTDIEALVKSSVPREWLQNTEGGKIPLSLLTGLHTCGDLAPSILRIFESRSELSVLCTVGCCYNLLTEQDEGRQLQDDLATATSYGFPVSSYLKKIPLKLGHLARNLAAQSLHRISSEGKLQGKTFFHRALLEKIALDLSGSPTPADSKLRNLRKRSKTAYDYMNKAFTRLNLPMEKLTPSLVEKYLKDYNDQEFKMAAVFQLRALLAPCIEALILLDRMCFLMEQESTGRVDLVRLFDPQTSPRAYGLVAIKHF